MSIVLKPHAEKKDSGVEWLGEVPTALVSTKARQLPGVPRRVLAQRAGHPRQLRVPQLDPASVPCRRLGTLVEKLTSPDINLNPVHPAEGSVKHPGLDNHGMCTIFEELVRRFNEENNEEAGAHCAPRNAVRLTDASDVPAPIRGR